MTTVTTTFKECRYAEQHRVLPWDAHVGDCSGDMLVYRTSHGWGHVSCERHARLTHLWARDRQYNKGFHKFSDFMASMDDSGRAEFEALAAKCDLTYYYEPYTGHKHKVAP